MTEKKMNEIIEHVKATFAIDGMKLSEGNIETGRRILSGKTTGDEEVARIINAYRTTGVIED